MKKVILINSKENIIIINFLNKVKHYNSIPPLIKDSPCDYNAKVCKKYGFVELIKTTKTGNTYKITIRGHKYINDNLKSNISKLLEM